MKVKRWNDRNICIGIIIVIIGITALYLNKDWIQCYAMTKNMDKRLIYHKPGQGIYPFQEMYPFTTYELYSNHFGVIEGIDYNAIFLSKGEKEDIKQGRYADVTKDGKM